MVLIGGTGGNLPKNIRTRLPAPAFAGVKIDGFPESDTSFHGFASVQRFKRRVGKLESCRWGSGQ